MDVIPKKTIYDGMKKYSKKNMKDIPVEGVRSIIPTGASISGTHFDSLTKGELESGKGYDWHTHAEEDELIMVLQGTGKFYWKEELVDYVDGDLLMIPANTLHKISASGDKPSQFFFIRTKV